MAYVPNSGSVAGWLQSDNASVIVLIQGSVATTAVAAANQSVSGTVGASVIGLPTFQTGNTSVITVIQGSVAVSVTPAANQSVSGTVGASVIGTVPVIVTDTTNTANVLAPTGGSNSSVLQGALLTAGSYMEVPYTSSSVQAVATTDVANYRWVAVQQKANGTNATTTFQSSNDNATWVSNALISSAGTGSTVPAISTNAAGLFYGPLTGRYFRLNITGITAASTVGTVDFFATPGAIVNPAWGNQFVADNSDAVASSASASIPKVMTRNTVWNGLSWDRMRGSITGVYNEIRDAAGNARGANVNASNQLSISIDGSTASTLGTVIVTGNPSISGTVGASIVGQLPAGTAPLGSVATLQGTNPWVIVGSVYGSGSVVAFQGAGWSGSVAATVTNTNLNVSGSVVAFQGGTNITSIVSTTPSSVQVGASIMGIAPVTLTANTIPAISSILVGVTANTNGSVLTTTGYPQAVIQITSGPGASITGAINFEGTIDGTQFLPIQGYNLATNAIASMATIESNWAFNTAGLQGMRARVSNWTVGSITARGVVSPADARPFSHLIVGNTSVSGTVGASIVGQLPAGTAVLGSVAVLQGTTPWLISSVYGNISGSVAATITNTNVNVSGSVVGFQGGTWAASMVGAPITSVGGTQSNTDVGIRVLAFRNDTLASIVASDKTYITSSNDSAGRNITKPFAPEESRITFTGSVVSGSVTAIFNSVVGLRNYVTDFFVANTGAATTLITFKDGSTSVLGYTIAPAGGGSNAPGLSMPMRTAPSQDFVFAAATSTSVLYLTVQGYKAP